MSQTKPKAPRPLQFNSVVRYKPWGIDSKTLSSILEVDEMSEARVGELFLISTQKGNVGEGAETISYTPVSNYGPFSPNEVIRSLGEEYLGSILKERLIQDTTQADFFEGKPEAWYVWKVQGDVEIVHGVNSKVARPYFDRKVNEGFFSYNEGESEVDFYSRIRDELFSTSKAREGQVFMNDPGKMHTVMCMDDDSYAIILEIQKGYEALTTTAKLLCVGNYGLSLQVHPSKEQVQEEIRKDRNSKVSQLFMNDPSLRLCDILKGKNRPMHKDIFSDYVVFHDNSGELKTNTEDTLFGTQTVLFENSFFRGVKYQINPRMTARYDINHNTYTHAINLEGDARVFMADYIGEEIQMDLFKSLSFPEPAKYALIQGGENGATVVLLEETVS